MKLNNAKGLASASTTFPPPKGGGPIEATLSYSQFPKLTEYFHRRKAEAPLKLVPNELTVQGVGHFHRRKAEAPLKPTLESLFSRLRSHFHRRKAEAPLKQVGVVVWQAGELIISTAERRRPH